MKAIRVLPVMLLTHLLLTGTSRAEIIGLSMEPTDADDKLRVFADACGLTFPAAGGTRTAIGMGCNGIPVSIMADRLGNIGRVGRGDCV